MAIDHTQHSAHAFLRPLRGCRALACLAVIFLHVGLFFAVGGSIWRWYSFLQRSYWPNVVCGASLFFAMKVFFLLTGILSANSLMPKLEREPDSSKVIRHYLIERCWRILPNYFALLAMHLSTVMFLVHSKPSAISEEGRQVALYMTDGNIRDTWAYVFLAANLAKAYKLVPHAWSLSVQAQWYLTFPCLLWLLGPKQAKFRSRVARACIGCIVLSVAYQTWVVWAFDILLPLPWAGINFGASHGHKARDIKIAWDYFSWSYGSFLGHLTDFTTGVLVYLAASSPRAAHAVISRPVACLIASTASILGAMLICLAGGVAAYPAADPGIPPSTRYTVLIGIMAIWIPLTSGWLLLYVMLTPDSLSKWAHIVLSSKVWQSAADHSYSAYCIHWEVLFWIFWLIPVTSVIGSLDRFQTYAAICLLTAGFTFLLAMILDWLLELMTDKLRRRQAQRQQAKQK